MIERNIKIDRSFIEALGAGMRKLDYIMATGSYDDNLNIEFGKLRIPLVYDYDQDQYVIKTVIDVSRQSWHG